jgi:hypothetical protein
MPPEGPSGPDRSCAAPWSACRSNACPPTPAHRRCCGCGGKAPALRTWRCSGGLTCAASTWNTTSASVSRPWAGRPHGPGHPEQADRWTWLVLTSYTQLRLARCVVGDRRLPWERPRPPGRLTPGRVRRGFRNFWRSLAPRPTRRNPAAAPQDDPAAATAARPPAIRPSRRPPNHHNQHQLSRQQGRQPASYAQPG